MVTRDILPQKSQVTLATQPAGLALDARRPAGHRAATFTGVVGIERDARRRGHQDLNGRRYRFANWSHGMAATHTLSRRHRDTTYTATFTDIGAVRQRAADGEPRPRRPAAATAASAWRINLAASASDADGSVGGVEFFENGVKIGATDTTAPYGLSWTPASLGVRSLTARATDNQGGTTTSTAVTVTITAAPSADTQAPMVALTAPADLQANLSGSVRSVPRPATTSASAAWSSRSTAWRSVPSTPARPTA